MVMKFAQNEVRQITEDTWRIILGEELELPCREFSVRETKDSIAACAQITGDWQLAVVLYCSNTVARYVATVMFGDRNGNISTEDIDDAMCELINIISGNIKGILSGSSDLSLPSIVKGRDFRLLFPRHVPLSEATFIYRDEPIRVMLLGEDKVVLRPEDGPSATAR